MNKATKKRIKRNAARRRNRQRQGRARSLWMRACVRRWREGKVAFVRELTHDVWVNKFLGRFPDEAPPRVRDDMVDAAVYAMAIGS